MNEDETKSYEDRREEILKKFDVKPNEKAAAEGLYDFVEELKADTEGRHSEIVEQLSRIADALEFLALKDQPKWNRFKIGHPCEVLHTRIAKRYEYPPRCGCKSEPVSGAGNASEAQPVQTADSPDEQNPSVD